MRITPVFALLSVAACAGPSKPDGNTGGGGAVTKPEINPPVAARKPVRSTLHGDTRVDDYAWLQDKKSKDVIAYLEAENAYADEMTKQTKPLQEKLFAEIVSRIKQTDSSVPAKDGDYYYYSRTEKGKQYRIYCRRKGSPEAAEEIVLDLNELAKGHKFLGLGAYDVSNDGNILAYSVDTTGFRSYTLYTVDLRTGKLGTEKIPKVKSVTWAADNKTLFYTVDDHAKRPYRVYRHTLGGTDDTLVYEEKDERFRVGVRQTRSKKYIIIGSSSLTADEARFVDSAKPSGDLTLIEPRAANFEYSVDHIGDHFYIRTNDKGRNFRIVKAPVNAPGKANWNELIGHSDSIMRSGLSVFEKHYVVSEREGGLPHIRIVDRASGDAHRIAMSEPVYASFMGANLEPSTSKVRFSYTSMTTPSTVIDYDIATKKKTVLKVDEVAGYDASKYVVSRLWATAKDKTKIPVSVLRRKDVALDGKAPLYLLGYGSYGFSYPATFNAKRVSLVDRGVIVAIAHVRGGGELGKKWHDMGRMEHKTNTFTDFIAVAEHLIETKHTTKDKLVVNGGSAGGLLMGAISNLRPDLFGLVVSHVPFVDVLNTMLNDKLPLTVGEYEEWGNPNKRSDYFRIKSYCPYTNIEEKAYPPMLIKTSLNDSQVMYWEPAKYVAKLRAHKTDKNKILFKTNMAGGHGGSSGRLDRYREDAFDFAVILWHVGIRE